MKSSLRFLPVILALGSQVFAAELPTEWIDADTGHRVIRLSREDGTQSLYFNQNAYTADGKKLIVTTAGGGISTILLATREIKPLVAGPVSVLVAGHKTGDVYYTKRAGGGRAGGGSGQGGESTVYATNVETGATREVVKLPAGRNVGSLNADETLLLGTYVDGPQVNNAPQTPETSTSRIPVVGVTAGSANCRISVLPGAVITAARQCFGSELVRRSLIRMSGGRPSSP